MREITYDVKESLGVLSVSENGWTTELNLISFNEGEAKYDVRSWSPDRSKMSKGVRLSKEEILKLKELLETID